ncbi:signal peptidase I [Dictyobacter alpinus]|uniref:signal peptidase I n=1 Tax=Dictyobacter alpinus TaxID=2014873 RepID=UPI001FE977AF|nr:signal peptidase I [Dictyobacter alpinus]
MDLEFDFEKRYRLFREIIETLVLTVLMFLVIRLAVQNFNIDGMSMEPSLHNQELVIVDKWSYFFHAPARGDVIVFVAPPNPTQDYIKRIVGLPGDVVTIQDTKVTVNNQQLTETYVDPQRQGNPYAPINRMIIPQGAYFVLGDNRNGSSDSRDWGCVPQPNVIGRAALVYWPLGQDNFGFLPGVSSVYNNVSQSQTITGNNLCPIRHVQPATASSPLGTASAAAASSSSQLTATPSENTDPLGTASMLLLPSLFIGWNRWRHRRTAIQAKRG